MQEFWPWSHLPRSLLYLSASVLWPQSGAALTCPVFVKKIALECSLTQHVCGCFGDTGVEAWTAYCLFLMEKVLVCSDLLFCCCDIHHNQMQRGEERVYLAYRGFLIKESQGRGVLCAGLFPQLFKVAWGNCSGMTLPTVGWALLYQLGSNQENAHRYAH